MGHGTVVGRPTPALNRAHPSWDQNVTGVIVYGRSTLLFGITKTKPIAQHYPE